jgi:hypothetical protein
VDDLDKRLVVFDARIEALEQTVEKLADSMLRMESILDEMAQLLIPESEQDDE